MLDNFDKKFSVLDYIGICTSRRQPIKFGAYCMGNDGSYSFWTGQLVV